MLAVLYGKVIDDKELGVYIEGVFFGGVAQTTEEAEMIAKDCTNTARGGIAIPKILRISNQSSLLDVFVLAKRKFDQLEAQMVESEAILESNKRCCEARRKRA